eukprot:3692468-Prymnesium_polylepis.1
MALTLHIRPLHTADIWARVDPPLLPSERRTRAPFEQSRPARITRIVPSTPARSTKLQAPLPPPASCLGARALASRNASPARSRSVGALGPAASDRGCATAIPRPPAPRSATVSPSAAAASAAAAARRA